MAIVSSPAQYGAVLSHMQSPRDDSSTPHTSLKLRRELAAAAFATSAMYDARIASHFSAELSAVSSSSIEVSFASSAPVPPPPLPLCYEHYFSLKYGCNPHQRPASIYRPSFGELPFTVLNGTPGYINLLDALNAWQLVRELRVALGLPAAASFKHCSPAGKHYQSI